MTEQLAKPENNRSPARSDHFLALLEECKGDTCPQRILNILTVATCEGRLMWIRQSAWYAVCLVPFLAVSFRISYGPNSSLEEKWPQNKHPQALEIVFIDMTNVITLLPASGYDLRPLGQAVRESFTDGFDRERNERLEFLEMALRQFLPRIVPNR